MNDRIDGPARRQLRRARPAPGGALRRADAGGSSRCRSSATRTSSGSPSRSRRPTTRATTARRCTTRRRRADPQPGRLDALLVGDPGRARGGRAAGRRGAPVGGRRARGVAPRVGDPRPLHRRPCRARARRATARRSSCCARRSRMSRARSAGRAARGARARQPARHEPRQRALPDGFTGTNGALRRHARRAAVPDRLRATSSRPSSRCADFELLEASRELLGDLAPAAARAGRASTTRT